MPTFGQTDRVLRATTPLGGDTLVPFYLEGREALSEPFHFTVDFAADATADVQARQILGKPVTIKIDDGAGNGDRIVNGVVHRFTIRAGTQYTKVYRAELVPTFFLLTHGADCRTFENKSVVDIVQAVLREGSVTVRMRTTKTYTAIPYVVQYRESNFAFVSRLLEGAGLYYAFEHADGQHTMVISDSVDTGIPACDVATIEVDEQELDGEHAVDRVFGVVRESVMHTKDVNVRDHDLLRADSTSSVSARHTLAIGEHFDFLGDLGPNASEKEAKLLIETDEATHEIIRGNSTCRRFTAGVRTTMKGEVLQGGSQSILLTEVTHRIGQSGLYGGAGGEQGKYESEFVGIPAATPWHPPRRTPRPHVRGTQVAKVVGAGGDANIDVDADGCILLEFPWDRGAGKQAGSRHRVHVAAAWAGQNWGFIQLPRIGQEVLVEYLEGEVDRPIVTGRVYNAQHPPPYALPDNRTQSGWKSRSVPNGAAENFNEIRFEDKKGEEHVNVQAEKDLMTLVKNDETRTVNHDRTTKIKNHDTREVTEGNDSHTIKKGNQTIEVTEGNQEITVKQGDQTVKVDTGKQTITVKADQTLTVDQGNRKTQVKMGNDDLIVDMGNMAIKVKMGNITTKVDLGKIETEAMQSIELKVGQSSIKLDQMGITIKGMMVKIEAQTQAELKGLMTKVEGSVMLEAKSGVMAKVDGGAMLMAKGAITMIG